MNGSGDSTIKICNFQTRREECTLKGHISSVWAVAITIDGRFIVSGSEDITVKVCSLQERKLELNLRGHGGSVQSIALSAESRFIVSGSEDASVKVWSIPDKREEFSFMGHDVSSIYSRSELCGEWIRLYVYQEMEFTGSKRFERFHWAHCLSVVAICDFRRQISNIRRGRQLYQDMEPLLSICEEHSNGV